MIPVAALPALLLAAPIQTVAAPASPTPELADPLTDPQTSAAVARADIAPTVQMATPVRHTPGDPLERTNRRLFRAHEKFDRTIFRPAALGYKRAVPRPVRAGLRNVFGNFGEPIVFLNYLLQLKPGKAAETLGRFAINSTLGLGGLIDVARQPNVRLRHRSNGFGNTLALYGVKPGPYLFLPFVGPTTLRDLIGGQADGLVLPLTVGKPFNRLEYQLPKGVVTGLDRRAESDAELNALFAGAVDPYATLRSVFLQNRQGEIDQLRGRRRTAPVPTPDLGEPLADPADTGLKAPAELSDPLADPAATPSPRP